MSLTYLETSGLAAAGTARPPPKLTPSTETFWWVDSAVQRIASSITDRSSTVISVFTSPGIVGRTT